MRALGPGVGPQQVTVQKVNVVFIYLELLKTIKEFKPNNLPPKKCNYLSVIRLIYCNPFWNALTLLKKAVGV